MRYAYQIWSSFVHVPMHCFVRVIALVDTTASLTLASPNGTLLAPTALDTRGGTRMTLFGSGFGTNGFPSFFVAVTGAKLCAV